MNSLGHNSNSKSLRDFLIIDPETGRSTGRIKITDEIMRKYLVCKIDHSKPKGKDKIEVVINDSEVIVSLNNLFSFMGTAVAYDGGSVHTCIKYVPLPSRLHNRKGAYNQDFFYLALVHKIISRPKYRRSFTCARFIEAKGFLINAKEFRGYALVIEGFK